mgnify:CR=1 FL=1
MTYSSLSRKAAPSTLWTREKVAVTVPTRSTTSNLRSDVNTSDVFGTRPAWTDTDAIDSHLGLQTARSPIRAATDGGIVGEDTDQSFESPEEQLDDSPALIEAEHECPNGEEWCPGPGADSLPCFPCYQLSEER